MVRSYSHNVLESSKGNLTLLVQAEVEAAVLEVDRNAAAVDVAKKVDHIQTCKIALAAGRKKSSAAIDLDTVHCKTFVVEDSSLEPFEGEDDTEDQSSANLPGEASGSTDYLQRPAQSLHQ